MSARKNAAVKRQAVEATMPYEVLVERMPGQFKSMAPRATFRNELGALAYANGLRSGRCKSYAVLTVATGEIFYLRKEFAS